MATTPSDLMEQLARLSPERRALLELKLKERAKRGVDGGGAPRRTIRDSAPLSPAQQRFWFFDQFEPDVPLNNEWSAVRLKGPLDITALQKSINAIVSRHEALRATIVVQDGQPQQRFTSELDISLPVIDLRHARASQRWDEAKRHAADETQRPFDLSRGPLVRAKLFQAGDQEYLLLFLFHHTVVDAWSATIFYRELGTFYASFLRGQSAALPDLPVQYADFADRQQEWLHTTAYRTQLSYWKTQLADVIPLELATDRPRPKKQTYHGAQQPITFSPLLVPSLRALSQQEGASLFMVLLAAFQTLLHRYTGKNDIVVGSPVACRTRRETEGIIGCFTNTVALRTRFAGSPSFRTLLRQVRATVLDGLTHQELPFQDVIEALQPERDLSTSPIFQVMMVYNNTGTSMDQFGPVHAEPVVIPSTLAKFDWTLNVAELESGLSAHLEYNTDLFESSTIDRAVGHLQTLLAGIVADPDRPVDQLPLLTEAERHQVLVDWNGTTTEYPADKCIHELFAEQVAKTPDAIAVVFEQQRLTYAELDARSNQLAHHLRSLGVGPEVLVGLCVERSIEMIVGLLAILKAGGAYVPLDPSYPADRIAYMLADARVDVLVTQSRLADKLPAHETRVVRIDADVLQWANNPISTAKSGVVSDNTAYVIYTSGSTGRPKGVTLQHSGGVAFLSWVCREFDDDMLRGTIASTSVSFDVAFFEIFAPLTRGGTMLVVRDVLDLDSLRGLPAPTLLVTVPSAARVLVQGGKLPPTLRGVNLAGEALDKATADAVLEALPNIEFIRDLYGPTEDTTYSTCAHRPKGAAPTIGRPMANGRAYVAGRSLDTLPCGIAGELYLAGAGLARGYHGRPGLTAERFVPNPFSKEPGARMYRTGDLARWNDHGNLEYLGRIDHQVKIRGFRIELGEIEAALASHPSVQTCVVLAREDVPGDKRLVAYVVPNDECAPNVLQEYIGQTLPGYMIPAAFVVVESFPLTPNGKVDRKALPAPVAGQRIVTDAFVAPRTPTEETIASIWRDMLRLEQISIHDDFFKIGGHSLLATQVVNRCSQQFGIDIALYWLFEEHTIDTFAARVDHLKLCQALQQPDEIAAGLPEEEEISL